MCVGLCALARRFLSREKKLNLWAGGEKNKDGNKCLPAAALTTPPLLSTLGHTGTDTEGSRSFSVWGCSQRGGGARKHQGFWVSFSPRSFALTQNEQFACMGRGGVGWGRGGGAGPSTCLLLGRSKTPKQTDTTQVLTKARCKDSMLSYTLGLGTFFPLIFRDQVLGSSSWSPNSLQS